MIITWTRSARCRDCIHFKYYYKGKRKLHKCVLKNTSRTLADKFKCDNFEMRKSYYPEQIKEK